MSETNGYSPLQIGLHWLIVLLIGTNYIVSDDMGRALHAHLEGQPVTGLTPTVHVWVGVAVLVLVAIRLLVRLVKGAPDPLETSGPPILERVATITHLLLYALLFLVPIFGMLAWFQGIDFFGDLHVLAMNLMMILAGLHALAALYHHFVLKDGTLRRMVRP